MTAARTVRHLALLACLLALPAAAQEKASGTPPTAGETLYRKGVLPSGKPLRGEREAGIFVEGAAAACATCHRRSGLGTSEGRIIIPPVTGTYLFRPRGKQLEDMDLRYVAGLNISREAHTEESLARSIREGLSKHGRKLNYLMPRFADIDAATMDSLIAYLKELSKPPYRGVTEDTLHLATIITPDADPAAKKGMLDVLNQFVSDKNDFIKGGARPLRSTTSGVAFRVTRRWRLHVWELTGPADGWEAQLRARLAAEPVLAAISGLGGGNWAPVHRFCEQAALPCLFPNVELPVVAEEDFYPMYFSKGVLLEAQLIAKRLEEQGDARPRRLVQLYRAGDIGEPAARALSAAAKEAGLAVAERAIGSGERALAEALQDLAAGDALALWLRPDDLRALPDAVPKTGAVFVSGLMGGLEHAPLPAAWRSVARLAYPADLPELRKFRMNFPLTWFKIRRIPVVAERVQVDTYIACGVVAEMLGEMLDSFVPDYLEERIESMLSYRTLTGNYPRLGLAQGQRFASKGGYIARFTEAEGTRLVADGDWIVP